ncbi:hypothetical protein ES703_95705 [subsurface metagenome]
MGSLSILDPSVGDLRVIWDSENEDEIELAKKQFKEAKEKGFTAYRVKKSGKKGEKLEDFDPHAEKIIMVPPVEGAD